jgi:hypothetical protein
MMTQMFTRSSVGNNVGGGGLGLGGQTMTGVNDHHLQDGRSRTNVNVRTVRTPKQQAQTSYTSSSGQTGAGTGTDVQGPRSTGFGRLLPSAKSKSFDHDDPIFMKAPHDHEQAHAPAVVAATPTKTQQTPLQKHVRIRAKAAHAQAKHVPDHNNNNNNSDAMSCFSTGTEHQHQKLVSCFQEEIQKLLKRNKRLEVKVRLGQTQQDKLRHEAMDAVQRATEQSLTIITLKEENAFLKTKVTTLEHQMCLQLQAFAAQEDHTKEEQVQAAALELQASLPPYLEEEAHVNVNIKDGRQAQLPPRHTHHSSDHHSHSGSSGKISLQEQVHTMNQKMQSQSLGNGNHTHASNHDGLSRSGHGLPPSGSGGSASSRHGNMLVEAQHMVRDSFALGRPKRGSFSLDGTHNPHDKQQQSHHEMEELDEPTTPQPNGNGNRRMGMLRQASCRVDRLLFSGRTTGAGTAAVTPEEQEQQDNAAAGGTDNLRKTICIDRPASRALHQWLEKQDRKEVSSMKSWDERNHNSCNTNHNVNNVHIHNLHIDNNHNNLNLNAIPEDQQQQHRFSDLTANYEYGSGSGNVNNDKCKKQTRSSRFRSYKSGRKTHTSSP